MEIANYIPAQREIGMIIDNEQMMLDIDKQATLTIATTAPLIPLLNEQTLHKPSTANLVDVIVPEG